ncbi:hypothetical protein SEA_POOMPHA_35 [Mycobacterium phage Poompha]|nr:hypothetical protein SEA_POOMPHA_35 [Mycobacterium phage Poompha]
MLRRRQRGRHWSGSVFLYGGRPDRSGAIWVRVNDGGDLEPIR